MRLRVGLFLSALAALAGGSCQLGSADLALRVIEAVSGDCFARSVALMLSSTLCQALLLMISAGRHGIAAETMSQTHQPCRIVPRPRRGRAGWKEVLFNSSLSSVSKTHTLQDEVKELFAEV